MEKIKNRQNEIKKNSANTTMVTDTANNSFLSPDKRNMTMEKSEPFVLNLESPDNKSEFPLGSFIKQKRANEDKASIIIRNEASIHRIIGDESASLDYDDITLMNITQMSDSQ
jgi:hypothetical protein